MLFPQTLSEKIAFFIPFMLIQMRHIPKTASPCIGFLIVSILPATLKTEQLYLKCNFTLCALCGLDSFWVILKNKGSPL